MILSQKNIVNEIDYLITICRDGQKGFLSAAENAKEADLKTKFLRNSDKRGKYITELQALVLELCHNPSSEGGIAGALHRTWMDIKEGLSGHDRLTLLESCEVGENAAVTAYENFMELEKNFDSEYLTREVKPFDGDFSHNQRETDNPDRYNTISKEKVPEVLPGLMNGGMKTDAMFPSLTSNVLVPGDWLSGEEIRAEEQISREMEQHIFSLVKRQLGEIIESRDSIKQLKEKIS